MGETKPRVDKLALRRDQQSAGDIVGEQPEPQQEQRVPPHQAPHARAVADGTLPRDCPAQHVAPGCWMCSRRSKRPRSPVLSRRKTKSVSSPRLSRGSKRTSRLRAGSEMKRLEQNVVRSTFSGPISHAFCSHRFPLALPHDRGRHRHHGVMPFARNHCPPDSANGRVAAIVVREGDNIARRSIHARVSCRRDILLLNPQVQDGQAAGQRFHQRDNPGISVLIDQDDFDVARF